jgi:hypothetical protein
MNYVYVTVFIRNAHDQRAQHSETGMTNFILVSIALARDPKKDVLISFLT